MWLLGFRGRAQSLTIGLEELHCQGPSPLWWHHLLLYGAVTSQLHDGPDWQWSDCRPESVRRDKGKVRHFDWNFKNRLPPGTWQKGESEMATKAMDSFLLSEAS
jgi:hypothetical protein